MFLEYDIIDLLNVPEEYLIIFLQRTYHWGLLDDLMYEIPGRDNYGVNISDDATGLTFYDINDDTKPVNTANYHRLNSHYVDLYKQAACVFMSTMQ